MISMDKCPAHLERGKITGAMIVNEALDEIDAGAQSLEKHFFLVVMRERYRKSPFFVVKSLENILSRSTTIAEFQFDTFTLSVNGAFFVFKNRIKEIKITNESLQIGNGFDKIIHNFVLLLLTIEREKKNGSKN